MCTSLYVTFLKYMINIKLSYIYARANTTTGVKTVPFYMMYTYLGWPI